MSELQANSTKRSGPKPANMLKLTQGALDWKTGQNISEHGDDYVEEKKLRVKKLNSGDLGYIHIIPDNFCAGTKPSRIGLLFSHNNGDFCNGAKQAYRIGVHIIPDTFSCGHEKTSAIV